MKKIFILAVFLLLVACSKLPASLDGTYSDKRGDVIVTFKPDGTGFTKNADGKKIDDFTYTIDGLNIITPGRAYGFAFDTDKSIYDIAYGGFTKVSK